MFTIACCLVVRLGSGLVAVSGWLVLMHTYLYYFPLSLSHCRPKDRRTLMNNLPVWCIRQTTKFKKRLMSAVVLILYVTFSLAIYRRDVMRNIVQLSAAEGHVGAVTGCFSVNAKRPISSVILSPTGVISRGARGNAVQFVEKLSERMGTAFLWLERIIDGIACHFPAKNALYCIIFHIQSQNFSWGWSPRNPQKRPRCLDPDTNFRLAIASVPIVPILRNDHYTF